MGGTITILCPVGAYRQQLRLHGFHDRVAEERTGVEDLDANQFSSIRAAVVLVFFARLPGSAAPRLTALRMAQGKQRGSPPHAGRTRASSLDGLSFTFQSKPPNIQGNRLSHPPGAGTLETFTH
jgi:hypothetical protein